MSTFYGDDRLFLDIRGCPGCGGDHAEMELKLVKDGTERDGWYRARCLYSRQWVFFPPNYAEPCR